MLDHAARPRAASRLLTVICCAWAAAIVLAISARAPADEPADVAPSAVVQLLKEGNERFASGHATRPHCDPQRRVETSRQGQHPLVSVLACSDSRVPVEEIFDEGVGDLFVVRVAGNVCGEDEMASLEYGAEHLGTPVLLVLGHSQCGAVTAVATSAELHGHLSALVRHIRPAVADVRQRHPKLHDAGLVAAAVEANVWQAIEDLLKGSPIVRSRVAEKKLLVVAAVYDLETGKVRWLGVHPDTAKLLAAPADAQHISSAH